MYKPIHFMQNCCYNIISNTCSESHHKYTMHTYIHTCSCGICCLHELETISKVKRFSVAIMFLSRKEQQGTIIMVVKLKRHILIGDHDEQ